MNKTNKILDIYDESEKTSRRGKRKKERIKKSDHKHIYELVDIEEDSRFLWFNKAEICKICGKEGNRLRIE